MSFKFKQRLYSSFSASVLPFVGRSKEKTDGVKPCVDKVLDTKLIGPSIKDMVKVYSEQGGDIVEFLKGNSPAIVETDPGQIAIMKANLDSFVKDLTAEELQAISVYMNNAGK